MSSFLKTVLFCTAILMISAALMAAESPAGKSKAGKGARARAGKKKDPDAVKEKFVLTDPNVTQRQEVYKKVAGTELKIDIFEPKQKEAGKQYPAIVFFFGGGWSSGLPVQFYHQCEYLAGRGMIAMSADYRVRSRQPGTTPGECVKDAKSAIRWARANAARLGIDPKRIAAGGGSAGGHIAAAAATAPGFEEEGEDAGVSCRPDALVLFNPFIGGPTEGPDVDPRLKTFPVALMPIRNVKAGLPPTVILFGSQDHVIPVPLAQKFQSDMKAAGNTCELRIYEGQTHGFFNYGRTPNNEYHLKSLADADKFLATLGWIQGEPKIK